MRRIFPLVLIALLPVAISGCGGGTPDTAPVNIQAVLDRTVKTLVNFDTYLRRYDYKDVDDAMFAQFNKTIQHDLNAAPRFHGNKIATRLGKDASITGHDDLNGNGRIDAKEPRLFRMEIDADNNRIIITSAAYGNATGRTFGRSGGFFAGVMLGGITDRQSKAGIKPGYFNGRNVAGAPATSRRVAARQRSGGSTARSRARSGGLRGGK